MNYELLQSQIIARLQPFNVAGITTVRLPETDLEREKVKIGTGKFTIIYAGSDYGKPKATDLVVQDETVFVQILIECPLLYGAKGIYNLISVCKSALVGFKPTGLTKGLEVSKHMMIGSPEVVQENGIFKFQIIMQSEAMSVENYTDPADLAVLIAKITLIDGQDIFDIPNPENP